MFPCKYIYICIIIYIYIILILSKTSLPPGTLRCVGQIRQVSQRTSWSAWRHDHQEVRGAHRRESRPKLRPSKDPLWLLGWINTHEYQKRWEERSQRSSMIQLFMGYRVPRFWLIAYTRTYYMNIYWELCQDMSGYNQRTMVIIGI